MRKPFSITLFLPTGDPKGIRRVEKSNWSGSGIAFPKDQFNLLRDEPGFDLPGVYMLVGNAAKETIYIGEADPVGDRLKNHVANKEGWEWGVYFFDRLNKIGKTEVQYLESELVGLARKGHRTIVLNKNNPATPTMSSVAKATAQAFLEDVLLILPMLGINAFEASTLGEPAEEVAYRADTENIEVKSFDTVVVPAKQVGVAELKRAPRNILKLGRGGTATYLPGQPSVVGFGAEAVLNSWPGLAVKPVKGDVQPWLDYVDWLCNGDKELARHLHNWIGYPLKHLGTKMYTALVLWSVTQGTGKTLLGELLSDIYGATTNYAAVTEDELASPYNSYIVGKQFILADECIGAGGHPYVNKLKRKLKRMVTQNHVRVSEKYVPAYTVPDHTNWLFTSNRPDALFLEDGDRRFLVVELTGGRMPSELSGPLSGNAGCGMWRKNGGMSHVLHFYQQEWDFKGFDPTDAAPMTAAKEEMLESGRSVHGAWVAALRRDPQSVLRLGDAPITKEWLTVAELLALYEAQHGGTGRLTTIGLGKELKKQGFVKSPLIYTRTGTHRFTLAQNSFKWTDKSGFCKFTDKFCTEIRKHVEAAGGAEPAKPKPKKY